jgi:hypothetical protein
MLRFLVRNGFSCTGLGTFAVQVVAAEFVALGRYNFGCEVGFALL